MTRVGAHDPFLGVVSAGEPADPEPAPTDDIDARYGTLAVRARKRHLFYAGNLAWNVVGEPKFGDAYEHYFVTFNTTTGRYDCPCYRTAHGETRRRKICSHVLAVILWRKEPKNRGSMRRLDSAGGNQNGSGITKEEKKVEDEADARAPFAETQHLELVREEVGSGEATPGSSRASPPADRQSENRRDTALPATPLRPSSPMLTPPRWEPSPAWLTDYRSHQWSAALEIVDAFDAGAKAVFLDAPTGSGKTAIADLVSRILKARMVYICISKQLQDQFLADYPYARVIKGRANYPTLNGPPGVTCDDCDGTPQADDCTFCQPMNACPYRTAKQSAFMGQVAVLNSAYWLREANSLRPTFSDLDDPERLFVVDECDTLENALMSWLEYAIYSGREKQLRITAPKKSSHYSTIATWMKESLVDAIKQTINDLRRNAAMGGLETKRRIRRLQEFGRETLRVADEIEDDNWIRDNDAGPLVLKPVSVAPYGPRAVWRHGGRFLLMSATIISADEMAESLGLEGEWAVVRVPMTFPIDQRPIHIAPIVEMRGGEKAGKESGAWDQMARAVQKTIEHHPGERVLVHTVSYALAQFLMANVETPSSFTYRDTQGRDVALREFRECDGGVLFAPSLDRGVDLKDDDCRVVIVAKVPFPNLGDKQISARLHTRDGQAWYTVQTIRTLVQMTGRAVRSEDDWCESYILDGQFVKNIWRRHRKLLPEWWRDAVNNRFRVKDLL